MTQKPTNFHRFAINGVPLNQYTLLFVVIWCIIAPCCVTYTLQGWRYGPYIIDFLNTKQIHTHSLTQEQYKFHIFNYLFIKYSFPAQQCSIHNVISDYIVYWNFRCKLSQHICWAPERDYIIWHQRSSWINPHGVMLFSSLCNCIYV